MRIILLDMKKMLIFLTVLVFLPGCKTDALALSERKANTTSNLIQIKNSSFDMGSPDSEQGRRGDEILHNVILSAFYISKTPVSQKEYQAVMGNNPGSKNNIDEPVDNVSWYDAVNYCNELSIKEKLTPVYAYNGNNVIWNNAANGYRLPTEAEWEYACKTDSVQFFSAAEWCWDWYGEYDLNNPADPLGPDEGLLNQKIVRGFPDNETVKNPSARFYADSSGGIENLSFRIARSAIK